MTDTRWGFEMGGRRTLKVVVVVKAVVGRSGIRVRVREMRLKNATGMTSLRARVRQLRRQILAKRPRLATRPIPKAANAATAGEGEAEG